MISCIIILSKDHESRGMCLRHTLLSIGKQSYRDWEVIIIHNNSKLALSKLIKNLPLQSIVKEKYTIHNSKGEYSYSAMQNYGVQKSRGDIFLFINGDIIIDDNNIFEEIQKGAQEFVYGYGANKKWTQPMGRYENNIDNIYTSIVNNDHTIRKNHIGDIPQEICTDKTYPNKSLIGDFGYCKRTAFLKVGGFPNLLGQYFEDQLLMYKLFKAYGAGKPINSISIIQLSKTIENHISNEIHLYFDELIKDGTMRFNIQKLLSGKNDTIIQTLKEYHVDYRIEDAYNDYLTYIPGNIKKDDYTSQDIWKEKIRYSLQDFCIITHSLISSGTLESFVKHSMSDFDNLIPLIYSAIKHDLIIINKKGEIHSNFRFKHFPEFQTDQTPGSFEYPNEDYNQFPCDTISRQRRFELLKERYPFTDYIKIALIGDDDLISSVFGKERWIDVSIFEKDIRINDHITPNHNIRFIECDLQKENLYSKEQPNIHTFFTDPPYTLHGTLLFIYHGLSLLKNDHTTKEFYVILNQTMVGKYLLDIQNFLAESGIWIHQIRENFSQYELPQTFKERNRADDFLLIHDIIPQTLSTSSSSNLYIFRTNKFNLKQLRSRIDINKIYDHYIS